MVIKIRWDKIWPGYHYKINTQPTCMVSWANSLCVMKQNKWRLPINKLKEFWSHSCMKMVITNSTKWNLCYSICLFVIHKLINVYRRQNDISYTYQYFNSRETKMLYWVQTWKLLLNIFILEVLSLTAYSPSVDQANSSADPKDLFLHASAV